MSQQEIFHSSIVWVILSAAVCFFSKNCSHAFFQRYHNYFNRKLAAIQSINGTVYFSDVNHIFVFCFAFCSPGLILESKCMCGIFRKRVKRAKYLKYLAKMYKIRKYFEKGQPHACDYHTHETARTCPAAILFYFHFPGVTSLLSKHELLRQNTLLSGTATILNKISAKQLHSQSSHFFKEATFLQ